MVSGHVLVVLCEEEEVVGGLDPNMVVESVCVCEVCVTDPKDVGGAD